jgi:outer membrane protein OmpA-like peptidoglycan-associated protein
MHFFDSFLSEWRKVLMGTMALLIFASIVPAQSDIQRQTIAITYPLDETIKVKFRGTTRFPRLKGEAKIKRTGRRGTQVELNIENLPRAIELGAAYTTYVLWGISPEGRVDNLGEIKRSGSVVVDSKINATTPLQTFSLIVTAEPHFLVRGPSRMVILENLPPLKEENAEVQTVSVQYIGNSSDYLKDQQIPEIASADYLTTPVSILGARQAINLARYAGAESNAPDQFKDAKAQLEQAENAWRLKQPEAEVDALARRAISLGVRAEEVAESQRAAKQRREEIARRDAAVREAEKSAETAAEQIAELQAALEREQRSRETVERDLVNANQQINDLRSEVGRLRDELQTARSEGENAKVKLARIEGERSVEEARREKERRILEFKDSLLKFGNVRQIERGIVLTLPESLWTTARTAKLSPTSSTTLEPLAALLANNPDYKIVIDSYTDNSGAQAALRKLTQDRADTLAAQLATGGVDGTRIQSNGMGSSNPIDSNARPSGRVKNRRIEITLIPVDASGSSVTGLVP